MKRQILVGVGAAAVLVAAILFSPSGLGEPSFASASELRPMGSSGTVAHLQPDESKIVPFGPCLKAMRAPGTIEAACAVRGTWNSTGGCGGNPDSCCVGGGGGAA